MFETETILPMAESPDRIECKGVWGGIRDNDIEVSHGKVIASIYSAACCGGKGGDIYYFGVCKDGEITRLAVADVAGHGKTVAEVSQYVYDSLKDHM
jgi:sigma-B regulation protein RsbU (phosphoserine phosphatase)